MPSQVGAYKQLRITIQFSLLLTKKFMLMKISKLLVLTALCLTSTGAMAEIVDGVRQKPTPTSTTGWVVSADTTANYYLYNVQAKAFFTEGNAWGTQASVGSTGLKVAFTQAEGVEGVYLLNDFSLAKKAWKLVFFDSETAMFVDRGDQANYGWAIDDLGNGTFRMHMSANGEFNPTLNSEAYPNMFVGLDVTENASNTALSPILEEGEGHYINWTFVLPDVYEVYVQAIDIFNKASELKTWIDAAKELGLDVSAEEQVYLNEAATMEELEAAILAVKKAIADAAASGASVDDPKDMTSSIENPNFDNASAEGWKGTVPNMTGDGNHALADVAEHYDKTFDTYQELAGMPKGVYMFENTGFLRGWWDDAVNHTNYTAFLYTIADGDTLQVAMVNPWEIKNTEPKAGATEFGTTAYEASEDHDGVTYYAPNDPSAARLYFEAGYYKNKVFFTIEEGNVKLGVKKGVNRGSEWAVFDNFKLTFYGGAPEAYQFWVSQTPKTDFSGMTVSVQYLEAYNAAFEAKASNKAEAVAAVAAINAAADSINKNASLWSELLKAFEDAQQYTIGDYDGLEAAQALGDFFFDLEDEVINAEVKTQSNAELQALLDKIAQMVEAVIEEYNNQMPPNTDVTHYIKTPGFEDGKGGASSAGWTIDRVDGGNVQLGGTSENHCFEAWHNTNFDIHQEISLPRGVYELQVQGYVRYHDGTDAVNQWEMGSVPQNIPVYVYMNDSKTQFANVFEEPAEEGFYDSGFLTDSDGKVYPDNMASASKAFAAGMYSKSAYTLVAESGSKVRLGVKGTPVDCWVIFDNFKLTYLGMDATVVKPVLEEAIANAAKYQGQYSTKSEKAAFDNAYANARAMLTSEDGNEMFKAATDLTKAINAFEEGKALLDELMKDLENMMQIAGESNSIVANEAIQWGTEVSDKVETSQYEIADIDPLKVKIREYILKMELPADYATGSANGTDVTAFIQTPSFEKGGTNAIDGWEGTAGYNFGNDANQKSALALEFYEKVFDMYQDLQGVGEVVLPNGNYMVTVNAFERVNEESPAFLYVASGENADEVELIKHADGVDTEAGETAPNDMLSSVALFEEGKYLNSIGIRVTDNKLRIGIKHEKSNGADWIIMDNFKLYFFGENSLPDAIENVTVPAKSIKVEFFTIDGRRVNGLQKGITIRKAIMDNGTVVVKKIRK